MHSDTVNKIKAIKIYSYLLWYSWLYIFIKEINNKVKGWSTGSARDFYRKDMFNNTIMPIFERISKNLLENEKLEEIRDLLLPKLMPSEIDVSNTDI